MRQFGLQIVCITIAFAYSFFGEVSAGDTMATDQQSTFFSRLIVCRELKSVLSLNDAFRRGEKNGWERLAIDKGRSKRYLRGIDALDAHVCGFLLFGTGRLLQTLTLDKRQILVIQDMKYKRNPIIAWQYAETVNFGTIYAFQVETSPPWLVSK